MKAGTGCGSDWEEAGEDVGWAAEGFIWGQRITGTQECKRVRLHVRGGGDREKLHLALAVREEATEEVLQRLFEGKDSGNAAQAFYVPARRVVGGWTVTRPFAGM